MLGNGVETVVIIFEVGEDGQHHPGDARLAPTYPFCPDAVVDAAVGLEPSVEKERTGLSRLPVVGWQTKVTQQQHRVSCRDPLGRVKPALRRLAACPPALGVLLGEQTSAPAVARYFSPLSLDGALCHSDQVPQGLPTNGRVPVEEPLDRSIGP